MQQRFSDFSGQSQRKLASNLTHFHQTATAAQLRHEWAAWAHSSFLRDLLRSVERPSRTSRAIGSSAYAAPVKELKAMTEPGGRTRWSFAITSSSIARGTIHFPVKLTFLISRFIHSPLP